MILNVEHLPSSLTLKCFCTMLTRASKHVVLSPFQSDRKSLSIMPALVWPQGMAEEQWAGLCVWGWDTQRTKLFRRRCCALLFVQHLQAKQSGFTTYRGPTVAGLLSRGFFYPLWPLFIQRWRRMVTKGKTKCYRQVVTSSAVEHMKGTSGV